MSLTQQQQDQRFAEALLSIKFQDLRKNKCVVLGKRIANKQISNEDIIIQVAELASRYIVRMGPISDPENGKLVNAIANGDAQFVIEYFKKYESNPFPYFDMFPKEGAAPAPLYMRLSQVSDIFLTMMSDDELNTARKIIFDKFLELFGGYFLLGADLEMDKNGKIIVNKFENIGTKYYYHNKYPEDVKVHFNEFVFSTFGRNLEYDKFVPLEIREATKYPFPEKLRLQSELSFMAQKQIKVVEEAQAADIEKQQSVREASAASEAASEAARKAAQKEREDKVEKAHMEFEASEKAGYAGHSVIDIGNEPVKVNGGRRTRRHKRSGHKRSGKRSGHKRSVHKSRRR
jgi:hypothetical protein